MKKQEDELLKELYQAEETQSQAEASINSIDDPQDTESNQQEAENSEQHYQIKPDEETQNS